MNPHYDDAFLGDCMARPRWPFGRWQQAAAEGRRSLEDAALTTISGLGPKEMRPLSVPATPRKSIRLARKKCITVGCRAPTWGEPICVNHRPTFLPDEQWVPTPDVLVMECFVCHESLRLTRSPHTYGGDFHCPSCEFPFRVDFDAVAVWAYEMRVHQKYLQWLA